MAASKLRTASWWLKHPRLYPQFLRVLKSRVLGQSQSPNTEEEAKRWCEERAISTSGAIARITGSPLRESVREKFEAEFATAEEAANKCPVKMGGAGNLDLLYWLAEHLKAEKVIETGVAYGWSSLALLLSLVNRKNALLVSTDMPYPNRNNDKYVGCVVPVEFKSRWHVIDCADMEAIPRALRRLDTVDMVHYDSDKSYQGRMWAYPRLWEALRSGGYFISDDVQDNLAFKSFCNQLNTEPIIVRTPADPMVPAPGDTKYVGILIKKPDQESSTR